MSDKPMTLDARVTVLKEVGNPALASNALEVGDGFTDFYWTDKNQSGVVLSPPFNPAVLKTLVQNNNTLGQCVAAYEVNIGGVGYNITPVGGTTGSSEEEAKVNSVKELFDNPYPGLTFTTLRRKLRSDMESCGYSTLEIIRDANGQITFFRPLPAETVRLARLSKAIPITVEVVRQGEARNVVLMVRPRRYVQQVGSKLVWFKEFGLEASLDKNNGRWASKGEVVPKDLATEVIWFGVNDDVNTPYSVPRWINQLPSVLGSRQAEELNLGYFGSGGIPPVLVFVSGGMLDNGVRKQLEAVLTGQAANKLRGCIIEIQSSSGSLDKESIPKVDVERFGAEQAKDSMFESYDDKCHKRILSSFRLPPIFVGDPSAYNYNSARVAYVVAEAQVFKPERMEFDGIINATIMKEIAPGYRFHSDPMTMNDVDLRLKAIAMAGSKGLISIKEYMDGLSEVSGLSMHPMKGVGDEAVPVGPTGGSNIVAKSELGSVLELVDGWSACLMGEAKINPTIRASLEDSLLSLSSSDRALFDEALASRLVGFSEHDPEGIAEIMGCVCETSY